MPELTPEQMAQGLARFFAKNPHIKCKIDALTEREADILGVPLDEWRHIEAHKEISKAAASFGEDSHEFFLRFVANSEEEYAAMVAANRAAIQAALLGE